MAKEINRIYNEDCLAGMRDIPDKSVDLVVTDPPYGIDYYSNWSKNSEYRNKVKSVNGISNDERDNNEFLTEIIRELNRIMKDDSHIYWFTRWDKVAEHSVLLSNHFKIKNSIIWMKNNWSMGDLKGAYAGQYENILFAHKGRRLLNEVRGKKRHSDILQFDRVPSNRLNHSHEKPVDLLSLLIEKSSTRGDVIFDPFIGSGTTAVSAINTNRNFIGFELDEGYCEIANQRISEALRNINGTTTEGSE